jgi:hypothetical protein
MTDPAEFAAAFSELLGREPRKPEEPTPLTPRQETALRLPERLLAVSIRRWSQGS